MREARLEPRGLQAEDRLAALGHLAPVGGDEGRPREDAVDLERGAHEGGAGALPLARAAAVLPRRLAVAGGPTSAVAISQLNRGVRASSDPFSAIRFSPANTRSVVDSPSPASA